MASNLSIRKNGTTYPYIGGEIIKFANIQVSEIYVKKNNVKSLVWQYDITAPTLTIAAPTSTSSTSPTFTNSATYRVNGTISDTESGVDFVSVNGVKATISGNTWYCDVATPTASALTSITIYAQDKAGNKTDNYVRYVYRVSATTTIPGASCGLAGIDQYKSWGQYPSDGTSYATLGYLPSGAKTISFSQSGSEGVIPGIFTFAYSVSLIIKNQSTGASISKSYSTASSVTLDVSALTKVVGQSVSVQVKLACASSTGQPSSRPPSTNISAQISTITINY